MKKIYLGITLIITITFSLFFYSPSYASCPPTYFIGSEKISGCSNTTNNPEAGYSIDVENNKIILNNYNGGGIHFICHASCSRVIDMEIELIGNNTINSKLPTALTQEYSPPANINEIGFFNIIPAFTGSGTLNIIASTPFANEDALSKNVTLNVVNTNSNNSTPAISFSSSIDATNNSSDDNTSTNQEESDFDETVDDDYIDDEADEDDDFSDDEYFFNTPAGIILLISAPILLVIVLILLIILLYQQKNH